MVNVVSLISDDFETLASEALRQAPLADLIELRLDRVGHPGTEALAALAKACPKPLIVAVHGPQAFGSFSGSVEEHLQLLRDAACAGVRFVDVDWTLSLVLGEVQSPCHRIVSRHDTEGTPEDLGAFDEEVRELLYEGDVIKLVTHARNTEDGLRMLRHLRQAPGGLIAFCSGEAGSFTRVLAPIFGSPFTYVAGARKPGSAQLAATAPGQLRVDELLGQLPPGGVTPETAVLGVVGNPIGHSLSPFVQGMALKAAHLDAVYVAFEPANFERFMELLDDPNYRGLSVTAPFKEAAFEHAAANDEEASRARAVNTLVRDGAGWRGSNSDSPAVRATVEAALPLVAGGARAALVLGAGGAARAAVRALLDLGLEVTVAARREERAQAVAAELECAAVTWDAVPEVEYQVLLHCTPVGTEGDERAPIPAEWIRPGSLVVDAVYRPIRTPLLLQARARGALAVPGAEWFVRQAATQFHSFTRKEPDEALMRAAFEGALGQATGAGT